MLLGNVTSTKDMVRVQISRTKRIGDINQIITDVYEIPKQIVCGKDGGVMEYETWNDAYRCSDCNEILSVKDYIKQQIAKARNAENTFAK